VYLNGVQILEGHQVPATAILELLDDKTVYKYDGCRLVPEDLTPEGAADFEDWGTYPESLSEFKWK
jgi:hypothetical protein